MNFKPGDSDVSQRPKYSDTKSDGDGEVLTDRKVIMCLLLVCPVSMLLMHALPFLFLLLLVIYFLNFCF